jgi:hypothetical protein
MKGKLSSARKKEIIDKKIKTALQWLFYGYKEHIYLIREHSCR